VTTPDPVFVALTAGGLDLAGRLRDALGGTVHGYAPRVTDADVEFHDVGAQLQTLFEEQRPIVGICAAGVLIRTLAPSIGDKRAEPPVLAVAEDGSAVVPLLGGHRGANALATRIAEVLGVRPAITTAGELRLGLALDAPPPGWRLADSRPAKAVTAALLAGEPVTLHVEAGDGGWLTGSGLAFAETAPLAIRLTDRAVAPTAGELVLHPATLTLGIGAERGAEASEVQVLAEAVLTESGLARQSIACLASLDLKADEPALLALAEAWELPLRVFEAAALEAETPRLATPSETVFREVGCHGVAEAAALAAAGSEATLVHPKRKSARATAALAQAPDIIEAATVGRAPGRLWVVGVGPGSAAWRTAEAVSVLRRAEAVVGYDLYLDLVADLTGRAARHGFPLGEETDRVDHALALAAAGAEVALVSSGDAGIYAMAALVYERIDRTDDETWRRLSVEVVPGISALQAAAARAGAPLGHDFAAISLSDLLTPWPVIERRLEAAAEADFVVALYNPASGRRRRPLTRALDILAAARPPETPVIVARSLGRPEESVAIVELARLEAASVDMLTLLIVGNGSTRTIAGAGDRRRAYTPRGYGARSSDDE
jgi:cobalt-precorrin 5A hydrolase/precorrin-3B C17-methyltransferase